MPKAHVVTWRCHILRIPRLVDLVMLIQRKNKFSNWESNNPTKNFSVWVSFLLWRELQHPEEYRLLDWLSIETLESIESILAFSSENRMFQKPIYSTQLNFNWNSKNMVKHINLYEFVSLGGEDPKMSDGYQESWKHSNVHSLFSCLTSKSGVWPEFAIRQPTKAKPTAPIATIYLVHSSRGSDGPHLALNLRLSKVLIQESSRRAD